MDDNILRKSLDLGMLNIGDDDTKFDLLVKTSDTVSQLLIENPSKLINFTNASIDPDLSADDPSLAEIEALLKEEWKTFANKFSNRPVPLLRAVMLQAIANSAVTSNETTDPDIAGIISLSGISLFPYLQLGREEKFIKDFILSFREVAEQEVVLNWSSAYEQKSAVSIPAIQKKELAKQTPQLDEGALQKQLTNAAGPINGTNGTNPHWPNNPQPWTQEFGKRAGTAIVTTVNKSLIEVDENITERINALLSSTLEMRSESLVSAHSYQRMITELLWWKETLYSPSFKIGYRKLQPITSVISIASDLHQQVTELHPESMEFFLREVIREALGDKADASLPLEEFVSEIIADKIGKDFLAALALPQLPTDRRQSLVVFLQALAKETLKRSEITTLVGAISEQKVSFSEFGVWFFRDLQALRLIGEI
jgi:hypothetical protein